MKSKCSFILLLSLLLMTSCGKTESKTVVTTGDGKEVSVGGEATKVKLEDMAFFAGMSEMLTKSDDETQAGKEGVAYDLCDVPVGGAICFALVNDGKGIYQAKPIEGLTGEGFDVATVELRQVGDFVMLIAFTADRRPLWAMRGFKDVESYNLYRSECYANLLTGNYVGSDGQKVVFGDDHTVKGLFGVERHKYQMLTYMDYTSEVCHIDGTDLFFAFTPTYEGIDIYNVVAEEEGDGERTMGDELLASLVVDGSPQMKWAHRHPLTSDIVMAFLSPAQCEKAIEELKAVKSATAVEAWNLFILEAFQQETDQE